MGKTHRGRFAVGSNQPRSGVGEVHLAYALLYASPLVDAADIGVTYETRMKTANNKVRRSTTKSSTYGGKADVDHCVRLRLFNDRVTRIEATALTKRLADPHYTLDYDRMVARDWTAVNGVNQDDVDAFVLNVRILIQDGDGISLRCLRRDFYAHACTPATLRTAFEQLVSDWKTHLDKASMIGKFRPDDGNFTNGKLFDVLMYGGLAHVNPSKVASFMRLTRAGAFSTFVFAAFSVSLRKLLIVIRGVAALNEKLIVHIQTMAEV